MNVTEGDMIDFGRIRDEILDLSSKFQIEEVGFDPWQATMLVTKLSGHGAPCVEYGQIVNTMSEPLKKVEGLIRSRKIAHDGDLAMTWTLSKLVAKPDAKDNVLLRKKRPAPASHCFGARRECHADPSPTREIKVSRSTDCSSITAARPG